MRGVPCGMFAELYNPEMFEEHETIIVFTRDDIYQLLIKNTKDTGLVILVICEGVIL